MTRQTLLRRLKSKSDEDAWENFVANYRPFICSVINKMGINPSDIDDICQTILVKIWKSLDHFDHGQKQGCFRNWLYTITRNCVLTYISSNQYNIRTREGVESNKHPLTEAPDIENIIHKEWKRFIFEKAANNIKKKVSHQLWDAFQSGLNGENEEVTAKRLGLETNTINKYKNRIKYKLIAEIENLREFLE